MYIIDTQIWTLRVSQKQYYYCVAGPQVTGKVR